MKERLKKFYKDHEETIANVTLGSFLAAATAFTIFKIVDGKSVLSGDILTRDDGATMIVVRLKNGYSTNLTRLPD